MWGGGEDQERKPEKQEGEVFFVFDRRKRSLIAKHTWDERKRRDFAGEVFSLSMGRGEKNKSIKKGA